MEYRVKSLSVTGLGKKIFRVGEICNDSNFKEGRAKELVSEGRLIPVEEVKKETKPIETKIPKPKPPEPPKKEENEDKGESKGKKTIDEITKREIMDDLFKAEVSFNPNDKKEVLFELWSLL